VQDQQVDHSVFGGSLDKLAAVAHHADVPGFTQQVLLRTCASW
jgi:hypothetical protein